MYNLRRTDLRLTLDAQEMGIHDKFEKYTDLPEVMKFLLVPPK